MNAPLAGEIAADGLHINHALLDTFKTNTPFALEDQLDPNIFLLKLMPGTSPDVFDYVMDKDYRGVVLEAFGMGGLHYIRRNLVHKLAQLKERGIVTLVVTQCLYERADFTIYEVGHDILSSHVFSDGDMTTEAAVAKLMWVLGNAEKRLLLLRQNLCGEN